MTGVDMAENKKKKKQVTGMNYSFADMQNAMAGNSVDMNR